MFQFAVALYAILATSEVPHEVAPVHKVALVAQEEAQVLPLRWHFHHDVLATAVVWYLRTVHPAHPALVGRGMV